MLRLSKFATPTKALRGTPLAFMVALLYACVPLGCLRATNPVVNVISVCDMLQNIPAYQGKLVAVRGVYWYGLRQQCPLPLLSGDGTPRITAVFLAGSEFAASQGRPVAFDTDRKSLDVLERVYLEEASKGKREEIWATFVGVLQVADPKGKRLGAFGHLGVFPAQFIVKSVQEGSIFIDQRPTYDYTIDPKHPHL